MLPNSRLNRNNLPPIQPPLVHFIGNRITNEQAQRNFFSAIEFAHENEFPLLCDRAISQGANVNLKNHLGQSAIECAIARGSLIILRCLFARGALIPEINQNEEDILMDAALNGHTDIVEFLIVQGNLQNDAKDSQGMTALHSATLFGHTDTIKILLEYGSCADTLTHSMSIDILNNIFGQNLNEFEILKEGKNITPLMIATARQDYSSVNIFLAHHAKTDLGAVPPLLIAIKNNDVQMIEILSQAGAYSDHYSVLGDTGLFDYAINNNISTKCLECLLKENFNNINLSPKEVSNLLLISTYQNRPDYLALLLAAGIRPENDRQIHLLCANAHNSKYKISIHNMLASLNADNFEAKIRSENINFISELFDVNLNTYNFTQMGIFQPVTTKILQFFYDIKINNAVITKEQLNFSLAVELETGDFLNKNLFPDNFLIHNGIQLASAWITKIKEKAELQFTLINKISNEIKDKKIIEFQELISINSIKEHIQSKRNANEIANILELIFINEIGLPSDLANLIANVFRSGFNFILSIHPNNYQEDELALLTQRLIINLLNYSKLPREIIANNASAEFANKITFFLNKDRHHLDNFYTSPFDFIKKLENRNNLRPPKVNILLKQFSLDMGLPPQFCQYLVKAWSNSIMKTLELKNLHTASDIAQAHKNQFVLSLLDELETMLNNLNFSNEKFLEHTCQQLKNWCISQLPKAEIYTGKRHASDSDEPNAKRQRQ